MSSGTTSASAQLKHLNTVKSDLTRQLTEAKQSQQETNEKIKDLESRIADLERQIKALTEQVVVSEHAMLRYFERVLGYDLEEIRQKILPEEVANQVRVVSNGTFPVGHNGSAFRLRVKNRVVITLLTREDERE